MRSALPLVGFFLFACSRGPGGPSDPVEYAARDGSFSARLPAGWKVDDAPGETRKAAFFGPPGGAKPFSELIGVYYHASGTPAGEVAARAAAGRVQPTREVTVAGVKALEISVERESPDVHSKPWRTVTRSVFVPASGGFFSLEHSYPFAAPSSSDTFDAFLASFHPGSKMITSPPR